MTLAEARTFVAGKMDFTSSIAMIVCGFVHEEIGWIKTMEEIGFAAVMISTSHTLGTIGFTFGSGNTVNIPVFTTDSDYVNSVVVPIWTCGTLGIPARFNSTKWDVPMMYAEAPGRVLFALCTVGHFAIFGVCVFGLHRLCKSKKLLSEFGFIYFWEGIFANAFRITRTIYEPLSLGGGPPLVRWHAYLFFSTCEGIFATPSSLVMVLVWLKLLLKSMVHWSRKYDNFYFFVLLCSTVVIEALLSYWAMELVFLSRKAI